MTVFDFSFAPLAIYANEMRITGINYAYTELLVLQILHKLMPNYIRVLTGNKMNGLFSVISPVRYVLISPLADYTYFTAKTEQKL